MDVIGAVKTAAKKAIGKATGQIPTWDMSTKEARERQVKRDFEYAKTERAEQTAKMIQLHNYYNNKTYSKAQVDELATKYGFASSPPGLPYPFIHVESQVDNVLPEFQFKGRHDDPNNERAKIRQQVVDAIMYMNKVANLNLDNERVLKEIGNAFWKVSFDGSITGPGFVGDIVIGNPDPANIFPDPAAYDLDDCEFFPYPYRLHRRKARRIFGPIIDSIYNDNEHGVTEIYDDVHRAIDDDTLRIVEGWYKDDEGDIACSICAGSSYTEIKHIPKYWVRTRLSGNQRYPFVKYCNIPVRKSFWDKGEIESIMDLVDAGNREFFTLLMNDAMFANDIVLYEKGVFTDPSKIINVPGAKWEVKAAGINNVRRLEGLTPNVGLLEVVKFIQDRIEETTGNYSSSQGIEPTRVTTASGIAQLNERADARKVIKKAGRLEGFQQLAELIDWTVLEFYNTDRIVMIRGKNNEPDQPLQFNSAQMMVPSPQTAEPYYPKIDAEITAGEGIQKSKAFTLAATQELATMPITPTNIGIVLSIVDLLDLPNKDEIKQSIQQGVQQQQQAAQGGMPAGATEGQMQGATEQPEPTPEEQQQVADFINNLPPEVHQFMASQPAETQIAETLKMMQMPQDQLQSYIQNMLAGGQGNA
jgi:hypothetical protein